MPDQADEHHGASGYPASSDTWWRTTVLHRVCIRSFADGNADGIGDIDPAYTAAAQEDDPSSTLNLYRQALRLRRELLEEAASFRWIDSPPGLLAFRRGDLECWLDTGDRPVPLPHGQVLLGSDPGSQGGLLPVDAAVWVVTT